MFHHLTQVSAGQVHSNVILHCWSTLTELAHRSSWKDGEGVTVNNVGGGGGAGEGDGF